MEGQADVQGVEVDVSVGQHHPLWIGAGSAGIKQFGQRIFVTFHDVGAVRCGSGQNVLIILRPKPVCLRPAIKQEEGLHCRDPLANGIRDLEELLFQEKHCRSGIIQDVGELMRRKPDVQRKQYRSEEHTSELQSLAYLVCRLLLEKKKKIKI